VAITIELPSGEQVTISKHTALIGSEERCDVRLAGLEPQHARIRKVATRWLIESLGVWTLQVRDGDSSRLAWLTPEDVISLTPGGHRITFDPKMAVETARTPVVEPKSRAKPPPLPRTSDRDRASSSDDLQDSELSLSESGKQPRTTSPPLPSERNQCETPPSLSQISEAEGEIHQQDMAVPGRWITPRRILYGSIGTVAVLVLLVVFNRPENGATRVTPAERPADAPTSEPVASSKPASTTRESADTPAERPADAPTSEPVASSKAASTPRESADTPVERPSDAPAPASEPVASSKAATHTKDIGASSTDLTKSVEVKGAGTPPRPKTDPFPNWTRPPEVTARLGSHRVLMESGHQGLIHFPDEPICILENRPMKFLMVSGDSTYLMQGASWATSVPLAKVLTPGPAGSVDNNYAGISSVYLDKSNRRWIGFYHAEDREGIGKINVTAVQGFYGTICVGESPQDAAEIRKLGPAITADKPKLLRGWETEGGSKEAWLAQGVGVPSVCPSADGKYLMCWYAEWSNRVKRGVQICVARSPIDSAGLPGSWKKYYQGEFSEPGIGGHETPVVAAASGIADTCDPHVQYVKEWDRYVMVFGTALFAEVNTKRPRAIHSGLFLSTSQDGLTWNKPVRLEVVFPLVIVTQRCKVHPMLLVTNATSQRLRGFLLYGFTPEWPTVPHHLGGCSIDVAIKQKLSDSRERLDGNRLANVAQN
jgi:hypothetical protein